MPHTVRNGRGLQALANPVAFASGVGGLPLGPTYFVSASGDDANDGLTQQTPWKTIAKVNATAIPAGYNVLFRGGDTFAGNLVIDAGGSILKNTVYGAYGEGRATISADDGRGVDASDQSYITVQDLIVIGNGTTNDTVGVLLQNTASDHGKIPGCRVDRVQVWGFGRSGIAVFGNETYGANPVLSGFIGTVIKDCVVDGCTFNWAVVSAGIMVTSDSAYGALWNRNNGHAAMPYAHQNITIDGCLVKNCPGTTGATNWTGSGIFVGQTHTAVVTGCHAFNNGTASTTIGGPCGIWAADSYGVTIRRCASVSTKRSGGNDGGGFNLDGGSINCAIEYCYSQDNHGPGLMIFAYNDPDYIDPNADCVIRYCFSYNDAVTNLSSVFVQNDNTNGDFTGCVIHNCVVIQTGTNKSAIANNGGADADVDMLNNIVWAENGSKLLNGGSSLTGVRYRGNLFHAPGGGNIIAWAGATYITVAAWRTATGQETDGGSDTSEVGDPLFVSAPASMAVPEDIGYLGFLLDGYKLQAGSPARTAGFDISGLGHSQPTNDYFGAATTATAIGASAA